MTCSELSTLVTTQENSLLVWGSRPYIRSPLHNLLSQADHTSSVHNNHFKKRKESDGKSVVFEVGSANGASEHVTRQKLHPQTHPQSVGGSVEQVHRCSSLNLSNVPHHTTTCAQASHYTQVLTQLLDPTPPRPARGEGRRGSTLSNEAGVGVGVAGGGMDKEGIILEPTSVDLVGRCGLLSDLSAQGLQQAKLECVSSFAGNLLILIEAKVPEEGKEEKEGGAGKGKALKVSPPKPALLMSKRLMERRHWNRYVYTYMYK